VHLILPIIIALGVAVYAKRQCKMVVFFVASVVAALLIGMEIQEGMDE
jgi:hypothetical protein